MNMREVCELRLKNAISKTLPFLKTQPKIYITDLPSIVKEAAKAN